MAKISRCTVLGIIVVGAIFALTSCGLLITASLLKTWITYSYTSNLGVATAVANIDIGLWEAEGTIITTPLIGSAVTTTVSGDTADYDYFDTDLIKLCRAFSILAILAIFASVVFALLSYCIHKVTKPFLIVSVINAGFTVIVLMISLILVKTELKDGMSVNTSFYLGIAANAAAAVALVFFIIILVLYMKNMVEPPTTGSTKPAEPKTKQAVRQHHRSVREERIVESPTTYSTQPVEYKTRNVERSQYTPPSVKKSGELPKTHSTRDIVIKTTNDTKSWNNSTNVKEYPPKRWKI